ncbi:MAG: LPP20 family lipoprotein [Endomicrobiales bacterium]|nr:LPP20 family lipoprotein [Endomicrobiales bacterium]
MKFKRLISIILFLNLFVVLNAFCARRPDWVLGTSKKYPEKDYLTGVGTGETLDAARESARAEISKIFSSKVVQIASETQIETLTKEDKKVKSSGETKSQLKTEVFTEGFLEGIEVPKKWFDKKNKMYYALAVLSREKTRASLSDKISEQEGIIKKQLEIAKLDNSPVDKVRAYSKVLRALDRKTELTSKKLIVDPVIRPKDDLGISRAEIEKLKQEQIEKILFVIVKKDEDVYRTGGVIRNKVAKKGLKVETSTSTPKTSEFFVNTIKYNLELEAMERREDEKWRFYSWRGMIEIKDMRGKKVFASRSLQGQVSNISLNIAKEKAIIEAHKKMGSAMEEMLGEYVYGIK